MRRGYKVFTETHKSISVGIIIPGDHYSPFTEGLFQYLRLLLWGLPPGETEIHLAVSQASIRAFEQWRDSMPTKLHDDISLTALPDNISNNISPDEVDLGGSAWIANFEQKINIWFSIQPGYTVLSGALRPIISIFADFLYAEYPTLYSRYVNIESQYRSTTKMVSIINHYICFSDYVKLNHIKKIFNINEERISVIPHGLFDYRVISGANFESKSEAARRIREYLSSEEVVWRDLIQHQTLGEVLKRFPFEEVEYVMLSTKARPSKNVQIIIAAALELRRSYSNIKFIVTAPINWAGPQDEFSRAVASAGLQWDIISLAHLPPDIHAALFYCAALTIHPSPFEGGFPFTAFESLSMGTPILIADGGVAQEFLSEKDRGHFLFNPASPKELVSKIHEVISSREVIFAEQLNIIREFPRTLEDNASELVALFRRVATEPPLGVASIEPGIFSFGSSQSLNFSVENWWDKEDWGRWSNATKSTIRFWNPPNSTALTLELLMRVPPYKGREFTGWIEVNGEAGHKVSVSDGGQGGRVTAVVRDLPEGLVTISIHCRRLVRPSDLGSPDDRSLGFGLEELCFIAPIEPQQKLLGLIATEHPSK